MSLAAFHDVRFPMKLALGASGGPERRTEIVPLASGGEARNARWSGSRRRWDIGGAVSKLDDLNALIEFFEARRGRLHGFRFRDFTDDRSTRPGQVITPTDQSLGLGDDAQTVFQLVKDYGRVSRDIIKPVDGTLKIAFDGAGQTSGFALDDTTGQVTFDTPPAMGVAISAGYLFDCPVRFDTDRLETVLEAFGAGRIVSVPIIELLG
jgi:uncharacterized protein (TIGR02217 family)